MYQLSDGARVFDFQIDAAGAAGHGADPEGSILFPDKDLLFVAGFKRSGADLLLEGPDASAVILGYFRDERRFNIITPEGASIKGATVDILAGPDPPARFAQAAGAPPVQDPIGRVEKVSGTVTVLRKGLLIELRLGDTVAKGDVVQTGPDSSLTIKLNDGTVFNLSASARMVLNDMVYAADASANTAFFTLIQGLIGFVAGQVAKTGDMQVDTPVATMAIRGTAVQTEIAAASGVTRFSLLTEPDGRVGTILLLDKNNPSRVIASMSDGRVATLLTPLAGTDPQVTRIIKTSDDLRTESDFVRDLFQFVSSEPRQRRGSSDPDDDQVVPADLIQPVDTPDHAQFAYAPVVQERLAPRDPVPSVPAPVPGPMRGSAVEDGPVARLSAVPVAAGSENEARSLVIVPQTLPAGVTYLSESRSFRLDPTHPAFQHLGRGETELVTVEYDLVLGGDRVSASVTWTVSGRNDIPLARDDRILALDEVGRASLPVLSNDRDVDGDDLHIVGWSSPFEGSLSLDAEGNLVFDPGDDFRALSNGQTATVSFSYTISDGNGGRDTATATLRIDGAGTFSSPEQTASDSDVLAFNGQQVSLTVDAPKATTTATADLELVIALGPVLQPRMNILYLIDVSGSASDGFEGTAVGDLNGDGRVNTVLDAEIASLLALTEKVRGLGFSAADITVTIIPFNQSADPTGPEPGVQAATFNLGQMGNGTIEAYLKGLEAGGGTNFADALRAANGELQGLDQGGETNILYFLSDGRGTGSVEAELAILNERHGARISALGIGEGANLSQLDVIDNTDGASRLTSPDQIDVSILGTPVPNGTIVDLDVFVNGTQIDGIGLEDLILVGNRLILDTSIDGLGRLAGDRNDVSAVVTFESGEVLTAQLSIAGALPRSTDLIL